jgi:phosphatidylglycerol:prolipoprotein diacylglycerol transferase
VILGVLAGGRAIQVAFDEWPFYREHPALVASIWLGGFASHGLLVGGAAGLWVFARVHRMPFRQVADELVIPAAFLLGVGRIGNFIDGQIVGSLTDVPWGVKFPYADGFRHPVVLYDGAKNLLLIPLLLAIRRAQPPPGRVAAHFVFWYASLRIGVDLFRDYPTYRLGVPTGQTLNILMALLGAALIVRSHMMKRARVDLARDAAEPPRPIRLALDRAALVCLLLLSLTLPGNWTQDVPARYGSRHPGLEHSWLYPPLAATPPGAAAPRSR